MVSVLALSAVDRGFEHRSGQPKAYKIGIYCFSDLAHSIKEKERDNGNINNQQNNTQKTKHRAIRIAVKLVMNSCAPEG